MEFNNYSLAICGVLLVSLVATYMCLKNMKPGFGPNNLRVLGILLVACFSTVLALANDASANTAIGILGAIAGYLFGVTSGKEEPSSGSSNSSK
jgi:hypothetical protein